MVLAQSRPQQTTSARWAVNGTPAGRARRTVAQSGPRRSRSTDSPISRSAPMAVRHFQLRAVSTTTAMLAPRMTAPRIVISDRAPHADGCVVQERSGLPNAATSSYGALPMADVLPAQLAHNLSFGRAAVKAAGSAERRTPRWLAAATPSGRSPKRRRIWAWRTKDSAADIPRHHHRDGRMVGVCHGRFAARPLCRCARHGTRRGATSFRKHARYRVSTSTDGGSTRPLVSEDKWTERPSEDGPTWR
jgi:hypothetical protein